MQLLQILPIPTHPRTHLVHTRKRSGELHRQETPSHPSCLRRRKLGTAELRTAATLELATVRVSTCMWCTAPVNHCQIHFLSQPVLQGKIDNPVPQAMRYDGRGVAQRNWISAWSKALGTAAARPFGTDSLDPTLWGRKQKRRRAGEARRCQLRGLSPRNLDRLIDGRSIRPKPPPDRLLPSQQSR